MHLAPGISTKEWSLEQILHSNERFQAIPRFPASSSKLTRAINKSEREGQPLIIEGLHTHEKWLRNEFSPEWLMANGPRDISVRNVHDWSDTIIPFPEFIAKSRASPTFASSDEQERLYGKDTECPEEWNRWLQHSGVVPSSLTPHHANNLLSSRVETLMCYLGIGDTFTPCHKDLCASSGQNLMCYTENGGSSFWFMTRSLDAPEASRYFQKLKQELDHETHVITVEQLAKAPFDVFIGEQRLGDLVLVPPRSCHQVVNYGGITIKTSWSRMTLKGLETALYHELPIYRRVCRPETYRIKFTIYETLRRSIEPLNELRRRPKHRQSVLANTKSDNVVANARTLLDLFDDILVDEYSPTHARMYCLSSGSSSTPARLSTEENPLCHAEGADIHVTCDFCGADIFQSFFECLECVATNASGTHSVQRGDGFVICAGCYVEGRSCECTVMHPMQCRPFKELLAYRNQVAGLLSAIMRTDDPFPPLKFSAPRGTFRAACVLQQVRKDKRETKVCTLPRRANSSHEVPNSWALYCKKCHSAKCFEHLLMSQKLHVTDALLSHSSDSSHEKLHNYHLTSRERFQNGMDAFLQSQKEATKPDFTLQRAYLASEYGTCKPINSQFMSLGWYDRHAQVLHVANGQDEELEEDKRPMSDPPSTQSQPRTIPPQADSALPLPTTAQTLSPNLSTRAPTAPKLVERKRKRVVMDYIDVPAASYKAKRSARSTLNTTDALHVNAPKGSMTSIGGG
ncbi:putative protein with domain family that is part of the cupin metalloenzyme superfamily [Lyophyllum shimeji]|uniref:JmjC domain-containing protein n=1 Tax=Lyophyllum shimeji TaxID=47721 RepID=A0A9P3PG23_LYOSH|nr:putative protein with domain family that is part of the cupin metalloenzyme superfamily [Lyophyllum shimeji]